MSSQSRFPFRIVLAAAGVALVLGLEPGGAQTLPDADPDGLVEAMRNGGLVIFVRHARTEADFADQIDARLGDCSTQRALGEIGWRQAKAIGAAFRALEIPVGRVISSEYCRAWQTADLAFGRYEKSADLNFAPAEDYTDAQWAAMRDAVVPHLAAVPPEGTNTVLVGHDDPFEAATGVYPEPMGVTVVVRPDGGGGFELIGALHPDALIRLGS